MASFGTLQVSEELQELVFTSLDRAMDSVSTGETLIPFINIIGQDGSKTFMRLMLEDMPAVEKAIARILSDQAKPVRAYAFATDILMHEDGKKHDAIHVEAAEVGGAHGVSFVQKYQKAEAGKKFGPLGNPALINDRHQNRFGGAPANVSSAAKVSSATGFGPEGAFAEDEWKALCESPVLVFMVVAASDGSVDKKEAVAFQKVLMAATGLQSKLMRQVLADVIDSVPARVMSLVAQELDFMASLGKVADIVERRLSAEEARAFKITLLAIGKKVAEASGGFFGFGNKISKEEEAALAATFVALRLAA